MRAELTASRHDTLVLNASDKMINKSNAILVLTGVLVVACGAAQTRPGDDREPNLTFIHLNDTYRVGDVEEGRRGGFSRVATVVDELKDSGRDVRILHGGDFLYPSLESQLWGGEQMVEAFNFLDRQAPMYVVPGNHEFDPRSPDSLIRALQQSQFDWLADNLEFATGNRSADDTLRAAVSRFPVVITRLACSR